MKRILIFSGTTEGRELAELIADPEILCDVCVATEYGSEQMNPQVGIQVFQGRMDEAQMVQFMKQRIYTAVVDATHPYAVEVSTHIKQAARTMDLTYLRLQRETNLKGQMNSGEYVFKSHEECAKMLQRNEGQVLLTTGSKHLAEYCQDKELRERIYVRVLPSEESIRLCQDQGILAKRILALQGPFSQEFNEAMIHQYGIQYLVTKCGGNAGGFPEKKEAAENLGITLCVIGSPEQEPGMTFRQVVKNLEQLLDCHIPNPVKLTLSLLGIGMGNPENLTLEASHRIQKADRIYGADRMIEPYAENGRTQPFYLADQILPDLETQLERKDAGEYRAAVLFSGDTGFFSGTQKLYQRCLEWKELNRDKYQIQIEVLPGISSISYLASKIGISWQDACIRSIHGSGDSSVWLNKTIGEIFTHEKTFLIVSHVEDIRQLAARLQALHVEQMQIYMGFQLSYPEEQIQKLTVPEALDLKQDGLYTCLFLQPRPESRPLTHGVPDGFFERGNAPMTKEEIRETAICKMQLKENGIVYDVGCGTGSVAIEIARLSESLQVYGIEQKQDALTLIQKNLEQNHMSNLEIIPGRAPEALEPLPEPSHVFIGGSGGNLLEILRVIYDKNSTARIVITAISIETIGLFPQIQKQFKVTDWEIVQLQVARSRQIGDYHLMQGENPVSICSFTFQEEDE